MRAAFESDISEILGPEHPISKNAARAVVKRWENAGVASADPVLAGQGRLVRLTAEGTRLVSSMELESDGAATSAAGAVRHAMVARARLRIENAGVGGSRVLAWISERQWRHENEAALHTGSHVPDGFVRLDGGMTGVVQVGHTRVEVARLRPLIAKIARHHPVVVLAVPRGELAGNPAGPAAVTDDGDGLPATVFTVEI